MLTQIDVDSENAFAVYILGVTPKDSILVKKITGLNPPQANLFIGDYASDGGTYQGRRVGNRNVVLTFDINPNPALGETLQGWRDVLYKAFLDPQPGDDSIKLTLHDDVGRIRYVVGYAENFEAELFDTTDTQVVISLICPDPYIRDAIPTWMINNPGWATVPVAYTGTAETGFEVEIYPSGTPSQLTLSLNTDVLIVDAIPLTTFNNSQVIYVNTVNGDHQIKMALKTDLDAWNTANPAKPAWNSGTTYVADDIVFYSGLYYQARAIGGNLNKNPSTQLSYWKQIVAGSNSTDNRQPPSVAWTALTDAGLVTSLIGTRHPSSTWIELHSQSNVLKTYGTIPGDGSFSIRTFFYSTSYWGI